MKVRIAVWPGATAQDADGFTGTVTYLCRLRFDSLSISGAHRVGVRISADQL